jgi:hypothetical protein
MRAKRLLTRSVPIIGLANGIYIVNRLDRCGGNSADQARNRQGLGCSRRNVQESERRGMRLVRTLTRNCVCVRIGSAVLSDHHRKRAARPWNAVTEPKFTRGLDD